MRSSRRRFIQAAGAAAGLASFPGFSQGNPIRVGLVTVKTGPLASGGIDMERALVQYLKERNNTLAGRKIELLVADSGGVPAQAASRPRRRRRQGRMAEACLCGRLRSTRALPRG